MQLRIKVIPHARRNAIEKQDDLWKVYLTAPAIEGKANTALISFLAEHFDVAKNRIQITKGLKSRHKTIMMIGI